jgi:ATP dependent DNA ligase domain
MSNRVLPIGFIPPCLPTKAATPPSGALWLHEIKHDGFRVIARKDGTKVRLYSRPGNDLTYRFPLIAETVAGLPWRTESALASAFIIWPRSATNIHRCKCNSLRRDQLQTHLPLLDVSPSRDHADDSDERRERQPIVRNRPLRDTRVGDTDEGQDQFSIEAISRLLSASHRLLQSP